MNRKILVGILLMTVHLWSRLIGQEGSFSLFLESDPYRSPYRGERISSGGLHANIAPRDLPLGEHQDPESFKEGYRQHVRWWSSGSESKCLSSRPSHSPGDYAAMAFPEEDNLYLVNQEVESLGNQYLVREGDYSIRFRRKQPAAH
jgi:hypothetical protein